MTPELAKDIDGLRFSLDKSMRYHQRRRAFYETAHRAMMFLVIIAGSSAALDVLNLKVIFAFATTVIAAMDLVYSPGMRARDHIVLHQQFATMLEEVVRAGSDATEAQLKDWKARRIQIEADEPPIFWALEKDCYNEVCKALGRDKPENLQPLTRAERVFMQFFRFDRVTVA